jgi:hypothetical protein
MRAVLLQRSRGSSAVFLEIRMKRSFSILSGVILIVALLGLSPHSFAQTASTGAIRGTVTDQSGAVVPGAEVKAKNESTGAESQSVSQQDGTYVIPMLPPGKYRVSVALSGFSTATRAGVQVNVTERTVLDMQLQLGAVTTEVEVTSAPLVVQTDSSTLGEVVAQHTVESTPLSTRNFTQIINLSAGVAGTVTRADAVGRGTSAMGTSTEGEGTYVHGARNYDNSFQVNGVNVNSSQGLGEIPIPNPDTLQEFKVQTGLYDAAFGRNAGASVNVITRSGSNDFHGSLFEFWRNDILNANDFFLNRTGTSKPTLKQNQFGGTIGGPIIKKKLLFFGSYQGTRQVNGVSGRQTILLPALTDDRSPAALGKIFAGLRGNFQNAFGGVGPAIAADGSNINPVALKLLQMKLSDGSYLYPTPQRVNASAPFAQRGIASMSIPARFDENQGMGNFDYLLSSKHTVQGRFFEAQSDTNNPFNGGNLGGQPVVTNQQHVVTSLSHNYVITPQLFNQLRFGFARTTADIVPQSIFKLSQLGVTTSTPNDDLALININGSAVFGGGTETHSPLNRYDLNDDFSWVHGKHNVRVGGGILRSQNNSSRQRYWAQIQFATWPDFMLGLPGSQNGTGAFSNVLVGVTLLGTLAQPRRGWEDSAYLQDDYKVSNRLTMNLGVRYDYLPPEVYITGRATNIDPALLNPNPPAGGSYEGFSVPDNYPRSVPAGVTRKPYNSYVKGSGVHNISPRVGFAYKVFGSTDRFVLRGGYGIYRSTIIGNSQSQSAPNQPWVQLSTYSPPYNGTASWAHPFPEPIPDISVFPNYISAYSPTTALSGNLTDPKLSVGKTHQYGINLQSQVTSDLMIQVAYTGSHALDQLRSRGLNQASLANFSSPIRGATTNTTSNIALRVPYQGWAAGALVMTESKGYSWYNAMEITAKQRMSKGLQFLASYTFSKTLGSDGASVSSSSSAGGGTIGNQNVDALRYGLVSFDRTHRLVASYIYSFPTLKTGSRFFQGVLNGWSMAGVTTFQSGRPLTIGYTNSTSAYGVSSDRASFASGCTSASAAKSGSVNDRIDLYLNSTCFTAPAVIGSDGKATDFGNTGVGILRGPDQRNTDLSFIKQTKIRESVGLEFRAEFFNIFNTTQFANPATTFGASGFGAITRTSVASRIGQLALKLRF